jgi:hypothetical protein
MKSVDPTEAAGKEAKPQNPDPSLPASAEFSTSPKWGRQTVIQSGSVIGMSSQSSCRKVPMKKDRKIIKQMAPGKV